MEYRDGLVSEEGWDTFENALEGAVEEYVEGLADHLSADYERYNVTIRGIDSKEQIIDVLGLDNFSIEVSGGDEEVRCYDVYLPDLEQPLLLDVERSIADNSNASDEDREVVAYNFVPRSGEDAKFRNIKSIFQKITKPDAVDGNISLFYRSGESEPLAQVSSWGFFDEKNLMDEAVKEYEKSYGADVNFSVDLLADSGRDWRIYEFDFEDIDDPLHLEISLRGNGFSMNWKQDEHALRYRNFVKHGFSEAIENLTD